MAGKAEKAEIAKETGKAEKAEKEAFSEFTMLQHLEAELKKLGSLNAFPNDGMERYDSLADRIYSIREKIAHLKHRISSELELAAQINKNPASEFFKKNKDITYLEKRISSIGEHETKLKMLDKDIEQKSNKLMEEIRKIFPYWTDKDDVLENKLASLDFSFSLSEQFNDYLNELEETESLLPEIRKKFDNEQQVKKDLEDKIREIRELILDITSNTSTDMIRSEIMQIRENLLHKEGISCEIKSLSQYRKDILLELCEADGFNSSIGELKMMLISQLLFASFSAVIVILWHILNPEMLPYSVFILSLILFFSIFSVYIYGNGLKKEREQVNILSMFIDKKERTVDSIGRKIAALESQEYDIEQDIEDRASKLEIPSVDSRSIEELSENLEFARLKLRKYADIKEQERQLSEAIDKSNANLLLYKQEIGGLGSKTEKALSSWKGWLLKNNYPEHITIKGFDSFVSCAKSAQNKLEVLSTLRREAQSERNFIHSTDELVYDFCSSSNIKNEDIHNVFNSIKEAAALKKRLEEVNDNVVRLNSEKKAAEEILEKYASEVQSLFAEADVRSEKEFRELAQSWEQHWILNAKAEEKWHKLSVICGGRRAAEKYVERKRAGSFDERFDE
ncbi:MAG: hypothetical protein FWG09_06405 [Synergistaceae bacterium]|nr:hypothetical protein [Synergistaceae bacterium]